MINRLICSIQSTAFNRGSSMSISPDVISFEYVIFEISASINRFLRSGFFTVYNFQSYFICPILPKFSIDHIKGDVLKI